MLGFLTGRRSTRGGVAKRAKKSRRLSPSAQAYQRYKSEAKRVIVAEVANLAAREGFTYGRIAIRNQKRSWGSCSSLGNLNFSYKLLFLPICLREYIIVHELCHLRELNHSPQYWAEVAKIMPDYQVRLQSLRHHERTRGTSIAVLQKWQREHSEVGACQHCRVDKI